MSYVANQLVGKLKHAGPGQRFNILSAILPVLTNVKAFAATPATDILNSILGIPLQTVLDDFEMHARYRTPVLTAWRGEPGGRGKDVFGAFPLTVIGDPLVPTMSAGSTSPALDTGLYAWPAFQSRSGVTALVGIGPYARKSVDGFFHACGYQRRGDQPFVFPSFPAGDTQNSNVGGMTEFQYPASSLAVQNPRTSAFAGDGSHTCGPQTVGFAQNTLGVVPTTGTQRVWSGYSIRGKGASAVHNGLVRVQGVATPNSLSDVAGSVAGIGPLAGEGDRFVYFGARPTIQGYRYNGSFFEGLQVMPPTGFGMTVVELGGFYFGRRGLSVADMAKLYYLSGTTIQISLEPWQNPTRAMGYFDAMSHNQTVKLLDGIAAGTIDPQVATPAAVWDAVR